MEVSGTHSSFLHIIWLGFHWVHWIYSFESNLKAVDSVSRYSVGNIVTIHDFLNLFLITIFFIPLTICWINSVGSMVVIQSCWTTIHQSQIINMMGLVFTPSQNQELLTSSLTFQQWISCGFYSSAFNKGLDCRLNTFFWGWGGEFFIQSMPHSLMSNAMMNSHDLTGG